MQSRRDNNQNKIFIQQPKTINSFKITQPKTTHPSEITYFKQAYFINHQFKPFMMAEFYFMTYFYPLAKSINHSDLFFR